MFMMSCDAPSSGRVEQAPSSQPVFTMPQTGFLKNPDKNEEYSSTAIRRFNQSIISGFQNMNWEPIEKGITKDFQARWPTSKDETRYDEHDLQVFIVANATKIDTMKKEQWQTRIRDLFSSWSGVERAEYHVFESRYVPGDRPVIVQRAHLELGGIRAGTNHKFQVHADVITRFYVQGAHIFLHSLGVEKWTRSISSAPPFQDISSQTGFKLIQNAKDRHNWTQAINKRTVITVGGITVLDYNKDDYWDLLVSRDGYGTLFYLNDQKGGFQFKRFAGLSERENTGTSALWLDVDGDGKEELINTKTYDVNSRRSELGYFHLKTDIALRKKRVLTFEKPEWMKRMRFEGIVPCDVNRDSRLDILVLGYKHLDSRPESNFTNATDGLRNLLFIHKGKEGHVEEGISRGLASTQYSFVAACFDFDGDGDDDIFIGNDYGPNQYLENDGQGYFSERLDHPFHTGASYSMGVSLSDYDNTGKYAMSVSNMYSHAGNRIVPLDQQLDSENKNRLIRMAKGNAMYTQDAGGVWTDHGTAFGVAEAGWAWGNVFFDADNDTDKDLLVVNGFTSHEDARAPDY
jgi:hypothetical protein